MNPKFDKLLNKVVEGTEGYTGDLYDSQGTKVGTVVNGVLYP